MYVSWLRNEKQYADLQHLYRVKNMNMKKKILAECIGTMVLVLMGCGSAVFNGGAMSVSAVLTIAFAFGLSVVAMAYTIGQISGCHINPAITLAVWMSGRMPVKEAAGYIVAQIIGGIIGSSILYAIASGMGISGTGANTYAEGQLMSALIAETIFSFIFILVVLGTTAKGNRTSQWAGLAIGLCLVLVHIVCIPVTGTSVNPARSIGPALFEGGIVLQQLWLFTVAPFAGSIIASFVWKKLEI